MSSQNDTATIAIGAAAAGAFIAAILWNTAALWPVSIVAGCAIVLRPLLNYLRERTRLARERVELKQNAVASLNDVQAKLIQLSDHLEEQQYLPFAAEPPVAVSIVLNNLSQALQQLNEK